MPILSSVVEFESSVRGWLNERADARRGTIHFHILFFDGAYVERPDGSPRFRWVKAPNGTQFTQLACRVAQHIGRFISAFDDTYLHKATVFRSHPGPLLGRGQSTDRDAQETLGFMSFSNSGRASAAS